MIFKIREDVKITVRTLKIEPRFLKFEFPHAIAFSPVFQRAVSGVSRHSGVPWWSFCALFVLACMRWEWIASRLPLSRHGCVATDSCSQFVPRFVKHCALMQTYRRVSGCCCRCSCSCLPSLTPYIVCQVRQHVLSKAKFSEKFANFNKSCNVNADLFVNFVLMC